MSHDTSSPEIRAFQNETAERIAANGRNQQLREAGLRFMHASTLPKYSYNFSWLGRPIIQYPQDMVAMQELIWRVRPDLIIETGVAHGGSLIFSASMLALLDLCDAATSGDVLSPNSSHRRVLGIDIDIRAHNYAAIQAHSLASRIEMIQGSSIAEDVVAEVRARAADATRVLVCLDSNHTHAHVLAELQAYADLTSVGSYCVVFDTVIEDLPASMFTNRPWGPGDSPKTAVHEFLKTHTNFEIDSSIDQKLLVSVAPDGYLRRVR